MYHFAAVLLYVIRVSCASLLASMPPYLSMLSSFRYWRILRLCQSRVWILRIRSFSSSLWTDDASTPWFNEEATSSEPSALACLCSKWYLLLRLLVLLHQYRSYVTKSWPWLELYVRLYFSTLVRKWQPREQKLRWDVLGTGQSSHYSDSREQTKNHHYADYVCIQSHSPFCIFGNKRYHPLRSCDDIIVASAV